MIRELCGCRRFIAVASLLLLCLAEEARALRPGGKAAAAFLGATSSSRRTTSDGVVGGAARARRATARSPSSSPSATALFAGAGSTTATMSSGTEARRKEMLSRRGPHFRLDRSTGRIEFGSTANLVTELDDEPNLELISEWLKDERGLAMSIWDEDLIENRGGSVYRLNVMELQFVTLKLTPWVDMEMKTLMGTNGLPVFCLQSVNFDPNIELLPGMKFTAESLGITIEVSGQLRPTSSGKGVVGAIAFQTTGNLPPPLRLLPDAALKKASDTINETVVSFAAKSFQKGAREKYRQARKQLLLSQSELNEEAF